MTETKIDETVVVREWRYHEFRKAGFTKRAATELAESNVDLRKTIEILEKTQDEILVMRIVL